ncbi:hypothetical protein CEUSTIGMA_g2467.t1 [Chlamydomonas eustigma]|uniref:Branched-chain amino acid aminotransferase n=1 Tax=Chlamydomonas eustigma TaxID=1157962 RepID=A0A250WW25_9CHLO|nr:hypothetical protein CEUSTIGMA_g2467.t1 [Chlamydomonas eustigma]|eukprot:GAX75021.1 hypothetical protein CEUSTIGMA_g2467.t1 [Chlamydomonas eustigma]
MLTVMSYNIRYSSCNVDGPSTSPRCPPSFSRKKSGSKRGSLQKRNVEFSMWRDELPVPPGYDAKGILGTRTVSTPILSPQKVADRLYNAMHANAAENYGAFYSSELGGIVTNPAFFIVHMDDRMVHRGDAVFDTVLLTDGYLYQLPEHFARFKRSAELASIPLPLSDDALMRIILDTAAASKKTNGILKYWLSSGRGSFGLSRMECIESSFYCVATTENKRPFDRTMGWAACTSPIAPKPAPFGEIKSTNYLQNVLVKAYAEEEEFDVGLFVDPEGNILEGPNANFAMITMDNVFVTPPFDNILAGITVQRLMQLIPGEHERFPSDVLVNKIEQRKIHFEEVYAAKEAFLIGSNTLVTAITSLNGQDIADGRPGASSIAFANMLENDQLPREQSPVHIEVPYGYVTGMRGQII